MFENFRYLVNKVLSKFGIKLVRLRTSSQPETVDRFKYLSLIEEFVGCFSEQIFSAMPTVSGRSALLADLIGTNVSEGLWIVGCLQKAISLPGDICEFGVAQGATSALLANEIRETEKILWLFDSFEGLPNPTSKDELINDIFSLGSMQAYAGTMNVPIHEVIWRLSAIDFPANRAQIVKGFIETTIQGNTLPQTVCFAYIDFDFYEPILIALTFLSEVLPEGGIAIVDDYGFFSSGAKTAVDEFIAAQKGRFSLHLPPSWAGHFAIVTKASI